MSLARASRVVRHMPHPYVLQLAGTLRTHSFHHRAPYITPSPAGAGIGALRLARRPCATHTATPHTPHTGDDENATGYDPWAVLGLKPGASRQSIRIRYHELMRQVHPTLAEDGIGDLPRMNQINKAYELITKSPTLDKRYRNLVSDTQYFYYRLLPDWMARNVDEMPRYWSWMRWRTPNGVQLVILCCACYAIGRFFQTVPVLTTVFLISVGIDILLHTMIAPASLAMIFLYSIMSFRSYDMGWLTSPKTFLRRELGY